MGDLTRWLEKQAVHSTNYGSPSTAPALNYAKLDQMYTAMMGSGVVPPLQKAAQPGPSSAWNYISFAEGTWLVSTADTPWAPYFGGSVSPQAKPILALGYGLEYSKKKPFRWGLGNPWNEVLRWWRDPLLKKRAKVGEVPEIKQRLALLHWNSRKGEEERCRHFSDPL